MFEFFGRVGRTST